MLPVSVLPYRRILLDVGSNFSVASRGLPTLWQKQAVSFRQYAAEFAIGVASASAITYVYPAWLQSCLRHLSETYGCCAAGAAFTTCIDEIAAKLSLLIRRAWRYYPGAFAAYSSTASSHQAQKYLLFAGKRCADYPWSGHCFTGVILPFIWHADRLLAIQTSQ